MASSAAALADRSPLRPSANVGDSVEKIRGRLRSDADRECVVLKVPLQLREPGVFEGDVLDQGIEGDHRGHPLLVRPPKMNTMTLGRILFVLEIESWGQPGVPQASTAREGPIVRPLGDFGTP